MPPPRAGERRWQGAWQPGGDLEAAAVPLLADAAKDSCDPEMLSDPCSSEALEPCCVCLDPLSAEDVTPFLAKDGRTLSPASCRHYCHLRCALRLRPQRCPVCRVPFKHMRRISREGILRMTAGELLAALQRLHGHASVAVAADLVTAVFPIPAAKALMRFEQLALAENDAEANGLLAALGEDGLARVLRHLSKHSAGSLSPRPLSFYAGRRGGGAEVVPGGDARARQAVVRLCACLGGACHGLLVGCAVGLACGSALRRPPRAPEAEAAGRPPLSAATTEAPSSRIPWATLLDHVLNTIAPWHAFGSAFLAVVIAIAIACLSFLLVRLLIACAQAAAVLARAAHHGLWLWAAASLGAGAGDEEVGSHLWACCVLASALLGALCGSAHAAVVAKPSGSARAAGELRRAAAAAFWGGAKAGCFLWVARRRRPSETWGDGTLHLTVR